MKCMDGCLRYFFGSLDPTVLLYIHEAGRKSLSNQRFPVRIKEAFCGAHTRWCHLLRDESAVRDERVSTDQRVTFITLIPSLSRDLSGKTYFVTGSTDGIGQHTAHKLADAGADVIVHGRFYHLQLCSLSGLL